VSSRGEVYLQLEQKPVPVILFHVILNATSEKMRRRDAPDERPVGVIGVRALFSKSYLPRVT
jgi:hypothetical protein